MSADQLWNIWPSFKVLHTNNVIRSILQFNGKRNMNKPLISLSIGDPTVFGNLPYPPELEKNMIEVIKSGKYNGYPHSAGHPHVRESIAKTFNNKKHKYTKDDVFLSLGGSQAIDFCIDYLCNPGDNLMLPSPGFPLYEAVCGAKGIESNFYPLLADKNWEVDIPKLKSLINSRTRGILVNNPSNPCGSNFSLEHLKEIVQVARDYRLPIIADEVYDKIVYKGKFHRLCEVAEDVPVFTVGSISKQFILPGWRLGWVHIHDPMNRIPNVRDGMEKLTTLTLGPSSLVQGVVPKLMETPDSYYQELNDLLLENSKKIIEICNSINGIKVVGEPAGALYVMLKIEVEKFTKESGVVDCISFMKRFLEEESVMVLPGKGFNMPNHVRIVSCPSPKAITEAFQRMKSFCERNTIKQ